MVFVTNYHKLGDLNNISVLSCSCISQKSDTALNGLKSVSAGICSFLEALGENLFPCLFQFPTFLDLCAPSIFKVSYLITLNPSLINSSTSLFHFYRHMRLHQVQLNNSRRPPYCKAVLFATLILSASLIPSAFLIPLCHVAYMFTASRY